MYLLMLLGFSFLESLCWSFFSSDPVSLVHRLPQASSPGETVVVKCSVVVEGDVAMPSLKGCTHELSSLVLETSKP